MNRIVFHWPFFLLVLLLLSSCHKDKDEGDRRSPVTGSRLELSLDSLYLYAQDTYLWNESLPTYDAFAPRLYVSATSSLANLEATLLSITQYAKNSATGLSYEYRNGFAKPLYSYIANGNIITGRKAGVGLDGTGNDMGLDFAVVNNATVYIHVVEQGSPAALVGLARGMKVLQINGAAAPTKPVVLNELLAGSALSLQVEKQDGSTLEVSLAAGKYTGSPILKTAFLTAGNKTVAYIALARFSDLAKAGPALDNAFAIFAGKGITNMIIDLRYNEGGYVETAEYVANLVAPATAQGAVMYTEHYNTLMQAGNARILHAIPYMDAHGERVYVNGRPATYADADYSVAANTYRFAKKGTLNSLKSVVFIVSNRTASASELLINCLQPYMDVKLVGSKTYGKPVGFFGLGVDAFTVYLAQFRILNAAGHGDYYNGLEPHFPAIDDPAFDFGDENENGIAIALQYIGQSSYRTITAAPALRMETTSENSFAGVAGMVEHRLHLK